MQEGRRQHTLGNESTLPVAITEDGFDGTHALASTGRQGFELCTLDDEGDGVESPRMALRAGSGGVAVTVGGQRDLVHEVAGALCVEQTVGLPLTLDESRRVQRTERAHHCQPVGTRCTLGVDDLVEPAAGRPVLAEVLRHTEALTKVSYTRLFSSASAPCT